MIRSLRPLLCVLLLFTAPLVHAWSKSGHMVTAAIAYEDLATQDARIIAQIADLMAKHPDRGTFEVALGSSIGAARTRRMFLEMARWPDDIRTTQYDHPTWHYSGKAIIDARDPPKSVVPTVLSGAALEAFALNLRVAADKNASAAERAIALCWLFHLTGDMHQPLHAVDQFAGRYPEGDRGGGLQFVREQAASEPQSLHRFWDGVVVGTEEPTDALDSASRLTQRLPRSAFAQLATSQPTDIAAWTRESVALAQEVVFRSDLATGTSVQDAKVLAPDYVSAAKTAGENRVVLAGYRLSDLLRALFP